MFTAATNAKDVFGQVTPPQELQPLIAKGGQGAGGISLFLSNAITLLYEIALIGVTIMLVWGAVEWIISGGDKESLASARKRIVNAIIGLVLLSIVFAILNVFKIFTGFNFFR